MADINRFADYFYDEILGNKEFEKKAGVKFARIDSSVGGWSCPAILQMLNFANTCLEVDEEYLEIGTYCGKSLAGALFTNEVRAQVIDNFWEGEKLESVWNDTLNRFNLRQRISFYKTNAEKWEGSMPRIGVFFYDGCHDSGHTYEALKKYKQYLADRAIVIVDDYFIYGGNQQLVFPGHALDIERPVKTDVDRFCKEDKEFNLLGFTVWGQQQAVLTFDREK